MKNFQVIFSFILLMTSVFGFSQTDEKQIQSQVAQMVSDWNTHEFQNMDSYMTDDVEWVNIVGMWWKGRAEVKAAHQGNFGAFFKGVPFTQKSLKTRFLTKDVAVATLISSVGEFFPPDGIDHGNNKMPASDDILTLVFVKKKGKWLIASGQNTVVDARAANNNPAKK
ncbi:SgcJ/EcaC family oxidoreductase [Epilithonimonas ginsengisoli]|uniref:SgcJ/EcaC family oxidoreductase n=1 Tax=Epilithonimonas ginsengisoli TaxID=1245592 RepID=A0ABU4JC99_9FLAO|nr:MULTISPECIES: SgcJ/EcaC family oxidoreductase [Chryseobacterium group]MBV6878469.1 SgcJ/EcaC family oxidoreductase [Epilithonimonas sp. FP105]MDW8547288.1 SgcJ/EcaC family oxidoreductase [Epilithonimonas ginsengisoli]